MNLPAAQQNKEFTTELDTISNDKTIPQLDIFFNKINNGIIKIKEVKDYEHLFDVNKITECREELEDFLTTAYKGGDASAKYQQWLIDNSNATSELSAGTTKANGILKAFGKSLASAGIDWALGEIIDLAASGINYLINYEEIQNETFEKSQTATEQCAQSISDMKSQMFDTSTQASKLSSEYAKLVQGVNPFTNENEKLSTEEYEKFLDINNQLAELFPSLTKNYDDNGNAILGLSGNVNSVTSAIAKLVEQKNNLTKVDIRDKLDEYVNGTEENEGIFTALEGYKTNVTKAENELKSLQDTYNSMINKQGSELFSKFEYDDYLDKVKDNLGQEAYDAILQATEHQVYDKGDSTYTIDFSKVELDESAKSKITASYNSFYDDLQAELTTKKSELESKNSEMSSMMMLWVEDLSLYKDSDNVYFKRTIENMVGSIKWSDLEIENGDIEEAKQLVQTLILTPLSKACNDPDKKMSVTNAINSLFITDFSQLTYKDAEEKIRSSLTSIMDVLNEGVPDNQKKNINDMFEMFNLSDYKTAADEMKNNLKSIAKEGSSDFKELENYTKDFTQQQAQMWLSSTNGSTNAHDAIQKYEKRLKNASASHTSFLEIWNSSNLKSETKTVAEQLLELAKAGKLTEDAFNNSSISDTFTEAGISAEEATRKINAMVNESAQLSSLKSGITTITSAYNEKKESDNHQLGADRLNSMYDSLDIKSWDESGLEVWEKYKTIASKSTSSLKEFKQAQDSLATSFVNSNNFLSNLDNSNKDYYTSLLREMGIINASSVISETLRRNKARLAVETYNSLDAHDKDADALDKVKNGLKKCSEKEREYYFAKLIANAENIDTKEECQQLINLANDLHLDNILVDTLSQKLNAFNGTSATGIVNVEYRTKSGTSNDINGYNANTKLNNSGSLSGPLSGKTDDYFKKGIPTKTKSKAQVLAEQEVNEQKKKLKTKIETIKGSKSVKNADNTTKNSETKQEINWLERRLTRMQSIIDLTASKLQNLFSVKSKNKNLNTQISQTTKLMNQYKKAASTYIEKANSVAKASKVDGKSVKALSKDDIKKIQSGEITKGNFQKLIQKYGQNYADKINRYIDYYDKAQDAKKNAQEQEAKIRELKEQKYQNYVDLYDSRTSRAEAKEAISIGATNQNKAVDTQIKNTKLSYDYQIEIAKLNRDKAKADQLEYEKQKAIVDLKKRQIENIKTEYDNTIGQIDNNKQNTDNLLAKMESRGQIIQSSYYSDLNRYENQKLTQLNGELAKLQSQQNNFAEGSQEWYDLQSDVQNVKNAINDSEIAIIENNKKVGELRQAMYDDIASRNSNISTEASFLAGLLGDNLTDDKTGNLTKEGLATLGIYAIDMETNTSTALSYKKDREELEKLIAEYKNGNSHALEAYGSLDAAKNTLDEIIKKQQDAISAEYADEKQIYDLMTQRYETQLSYMQSIIDAKKNLLNMEKDLYDYEKNINNQTKNIASLEKQLTALNGDDSEEGRARRSKIQQSLDEANQELQDTEYERYISDQQNMLDNLYSQYEDLIHKLEKNFEVVVQDGVSLINEKSDEISSAITDYAAMYGYNPSTDMQSILDALVSSGDGDVKTLPGSINTGLSNLGVILQKGVTDIINAYNGSSSQNNNSGSSSSATDGGQQTNRNISQTSIGNIQNNLSQTTQKLPENYANVVQNGIDAANEKARQDKLNAARSFIGANARKGKKKRESYSYVNQKIYDNTNGKVLSDEDLKKLAKNTLKIPYDNATEYGSLAKKLKEIKYTGFKTGGIGELIKFSGENGLALVRNGEGFIAPEHVDAIKDLMNIVPDISQFTSTLTNIKPINRNVGNTFGDIVINADLPNVQNSYDFINDMKNNRKVQQALTIGVKDVMKNGKITNSIQNVM